MRALLLLLFFSSSLLAQTPPPMKSAGWRSPLIGCSDNVGQADMMPLDSGANWNTLNARGSGDWPQNIPLNIHAVCVTHLGGFTPDSSYAVAGHNGPNGDLVTPFVVGMGTQCMNFAVPVAFAPGEYFDVHAGCHTGWHAVVLQIWYTPR